MPGVSSRPLAMSFMDAAGGRAGWCAASSALSAPTVAPAGSVPTMSRDASSELAARMRTRTAMVDSVHTWRRGESDSVTRTAGERQTSPRPPPCRRASARSR